MFSDPAGAFPGAGAAVPPSFITARVSFVIRMALRAMGFCAARLSRQGGAPLILGMRNGFQVCDIDARSVSAEVIEFETMGDATDQALVSEAVSLGHSLTARAYAPSPIAVAAFSGCPQPARAEVEPIGWGRADANLGPEAGGEPIVAKQGNARLGLHRKLTPFGAMQPEVFGLAAASILQQMTTV